MADVSQIKLPNGSVYDLIDEKSGYITAEYIENKTDYEIPVSRVGEIVVGETAIGTDSTNFPTSKAVVDYVDERVVQEMDAIDVGVTSVNGKTGSVTLSASDVGALSSSTYIPQYTSDLTNDSGFITASDVPTPDLSSYMRIGVDYVTAGQISTMPVGNNATSDGVSTNAVGVGSHAEGYYTTVSTNGRYGHAEGYHTVVGGKYAHAAGYYTTANSESQYVFGTYNILDSGVMGSKGTYVEIVGNGTSTTNRSNARTLDWNGNEILAGKLTVGAGPTANMDVATKQYVDNSIPTIPTNISSFTNDSGYLTASDIASVMTYKGTKANYAALPSTGNTTGDVWHLTDTGAEYAWDGSAWQELGTAIDLSGYATKATTLSGYGITDAKIQNGTITLGSNTITPLTSFTETDPTVPSWAKQSSKPTYTAAEVGALPDSTVIPSKTSDLTNDSGFGKIHILEILSNDSDNNYLPTGSYANLSTWISNGEFVIIKYTDVYFYYRGYYNTYGEYQFYSTSGQSVFIRGDDNITVNWDWYITSETDPVFSASAAAGITTTDISNWNAKVSDDKTWNGVTLDKSGSISGDGYIPGRATKSSTSALNYFTSNTPTAYAIASYISGAYLRSTTPSANDNSTKVATTAYVDSAVGGITVPTKTSELTNDSGFLTTDSDEKLAVSNISVTSAQTYYPIFGDNSTSAATRQYDTTGLRYQVSTSYSELTLGYRGPNKQGKITLFDSGYYKTLMPYTFTSSGTIYLPDANGTIALTSDIPQVYSSTNTGGYLTMATLPIYDGTVV